MGSSRVERLTGSAPLGAATSLAPAIAFVGVLATTDADTTGAAFNRAAQMFVEGLLNGLSTAGLAPDIVLGVEPIPAFPRSTRLLGRAGRFTTLGGRPVRLLPFLNVQPLKWLTAGISVSIALAALGLAASRPTSTGPLPQYLDASGVVRVARCATDGDEDPRFGQ